MSNHAEHVPETDSGHRFESWRQRVGWMCIGALISSIIALSVFSSAEWAHGRFQSEKVDRRPGMWLSSTENARMYIAPKFSSLILFLDDEGYEGQDIQFHDDGQISATLICANTGTVAGRIEIDSGNSPKVSIVLHDSKVVSTIFIFHRTN